MDLDEVFDRLPPERLPLDRLLPDFARVEPDLDLDDEDRLLVAFARVDPDFARVEPDFDRDELDREEPDRLLPLERLPPDFARVEPDLDRDEDDPDRELLDDRDLLDAELRERDPLELPFDELRELDERRLDDRRRDEPPLRSAAGISSRATALASWSICFSRNLAIRSSSRLMLRASLAVSLSPTVSASDSMLA
ncbi:MAG TPA: hypothetical protein VJT68_01325 [Thermoleophilaceae bacterium]|nr:hypothetical protein [Thermoleophilaceae bacterium]